MSNKLLREIKLYYAGTILFSWSVFGLLGFLGMTDSPLILLGIWGPTIVGLTLTYKIYGKVGVKIFLKRFSTWKIGALWFIYLFTGFLFIGYLGIFLWSVIISSTFEFWYPSINKIIFVTLFQIIIIGMGEEFGWRGFALQRLQYLSTPLKATLILAFMHLLWHAPTYWLGQGMHNVPVIWAMLYVIPWTILFTWVYNRTNGSILVAVLFHGVHGATLSIVSFLPLESVVPLSPKLITSIWLPKEIFGPYVVIVGLYWILALLVISGKFGGLGKPPKFEHQKV